jgi:8-oxo-dGTP pyrophosphatase MutT (NUDIX family)
VVVVRPGPDDDGAASPAGIEVLVLRRSPDAGFVPGFVVFPGGSVDPPDRALAAAWFGTPAEEARACALRELAEEAGLVATASRILEARGRLPGEPGLPPPAAHQMPQIGHWIAPEFLPVRFDARFYALAADREASPTPDGVEVDRAWWATPADLLRAQRLGRIPLAWPTLTTLEALSGCATVAAALALRVEQVAPPPAAPFAQPSSP